MESHFCTIHGRQLHFLKAGKGAPIVLLHPSPSSAKSMVPLLQTLATNYTVIAIDTPGYGLSDSLPQRPKSIKAYCKYLRPFFRKMGLTTFAIYGSATGAQIAVRFGLEYPQMATHLFLDNAAHFSDELRQKIVTVYFPDLTPKADGSHLMKMWTMVHDLFVFFPWCFRDKKYRVNKPMPPAFVLHQIALEYMLAGKDYDLAYRAAFHHEKAEYVQQLTPPTTIFHWKGSIIKSHIEDLVAHDFPFNVKEVVIPADPSRRFIKMKEAILANYPSNAAFRLDEKNLEKVVAKSASSLPADLPKLIPEDSGAYLVKAWQYLRDRQLYTNSEAKTVENISDQPFDLSAAYLQKQLIKWMQQ